MSVFTCASAWGGVNISTLPVLGYCLGIIRFSDGNPEFSAAIVQEHKCWFSFMWYIQSIRPTLPSSTYARSFFFRCFQTCRQFDKVVGFKLKSRLSIFSCGYLNSDVYFLWPNLIARWGQIPSFYQYGTRHYGTCTCYVMLYVTPVVEWTLFTLNPHREVKELVKTYNSIQPWKQSRSYLCCWRCYAEFSIDHGPHFPTFAQMDR